jgi:transposase
MAKYKHYDYSQSVLIPVSLEDQLMPGTLEFAIHILVEERLDTSIFDERYHNDETGRWAYNPKILLKVVLLAYSRGLITSRKIERACKENVTFMALCCGEQPDHSTIATFVSSMQEEIMLLFRDVLLVCHEMDLLGGTFFALDGSKLPSNASKEWSGKHAELNRKREKIEKKVERLLREQVEADKQGVGSSGLSDRKKQIERLKQKSERIEEFLKDNRPKMGRQGREIKSNITDIESCKMATSQGVIQGYNGQALVDKKHQVIVHAKAFGDGQDHHLIPSMLDEAKANMIAIGQGEDYFEEAILTADSNYHDPTNLKKCEKEKVDAYIPDKRFRNRDPRFDKRRKVKKPERYTLENFKYNETTDDYVCPNGRHLQLKVKKFTKGGVIYRRYGADREDCESCPLKPKCLKGKNVKGKRLNIVLGFVPGNLTKEMAEKIDTEEGRRKYHQRIAIVEPVFANIKCMKGLDRFTLRGKIKVNIQWVLYCMVHNICKIMRYGFT